MARIVIRTLSVSARRQLRRRAMRHRRSLEAEARVILERVAREPEIPATEPERFPDWFMRATRPGIDLDPAIEQNRTLPDDLLEIGERYAGLPTYDDESEDGQDVPGTVPEDEAWSAS